MTTTLARTMLASKPFQPLQVGFDGLPAHRIAVTIELEDFRPGIAAAPLPAYPYRADRLVRAASARTRDAGHRHGDAGAGVHQCPGHHLDHRLAADRTVRFQRLRANAQQGLLG